MTFDEANNRVRSAKRNANGQHAWYGRKSTRRRVSLRGVTYARLKAHAAALGIRPTTLVEQWIAEHLDAKETP